MKPARAYDLVTIPASAPVERPVIVLEIDAADCRDLVRGIVPEHVRTNCLACLHWCQLPEE